MIRPLYKAKEPFQEVAAGHGFIGVIMYDEDEDKVQCHMCGRWFSFLGSHLKSHKTSADKYKMANGLTLKVNLCGKRMSAQRRTQMLDEIQQKGRHLAWQKNRKVASQKKRQHGTKTVQSQNKFGLCELQMKARYEVVRKIVGTMPTEGHIRKHDHALYSAIERRYKTINKWREHVGDKPMTAAQHSQFPDIDLVASLRRKYAEVGRIPKTKDFQKAAKGYPQYGTIIERFGSWKAALEVSGIGPA